MRSVPHKVANVHNLSIYFYFIILLTFQMSTVFQENKKYIFVDFFGKICDNIHNNNHNLIFCIFDYANIRYSNIRGNLYAQNL